MLLYVDFSFESLTREFSRVRVCVTVSRSAKSTVVLLFDSPISLAVPIILKENSINWRMLAPKPSAVKGSISVTLRQCKTDDGRSRNDQFQDQSGHENWGCSFYRASAYSDLIILRCYTPGVAVPKQHARTYQQLSQRALRQRTQKISCPLAARQISIFQWAGS